MQSAEILLRDPQGVTHRSFHDIMIRIFGQNLFFTETQLFIRHIITDTLFCRLAVSPGTWGLARNDSVWIRRRTYFEQTLLKLFALK